MFKWNKKAITYFIYYKFTDEKGKVGHGNMPVDCKSEIKSFDTIRDIINKIEEESGYKNVIICNYIKLGGCVWKWD